MAAAVVIIKFTVVILFSLYRVFYFALPHHPTPIPLMDIHVMYHAVVSRLTSHDILGGYFFSLSLIILHPFLLWLLTWCITRR